MEIDPFNAEIVVTLYDGVQFMEKSFPLYATSQKQFETSLLMFDAVGAVKKEYPKGYPHHVRGTFITADATVIAYIRTTAGVEIISDEN